jgi:hypothetical protein
LAIAVTELEPVTNDGKQAVDLEIPYVARVVIEGAAPILFHRWSNEAVQAGGKAPKGSAAKKTDNVESYVYRCDNGNIGIPGEYLRQSIIMAAKFRQDPRSPRKSAMDLFKAGVVSLTDLADTGVAEWDYLDQRRAVVQRAGITRTRPALKAGWRVEVWFNVLVPEYIDPSLLNEVTQSAGRLVGVGDFRPTYGRFQVVSFQVENLA